MHHFNRRLFTLFSVLYIGFSLPAIGQETAGCGAWYDPAALFQVAADAPCLPTYQRESSVVFSVASDVLVQLQSERPAIGNSLYISRRC